MNFVRNKTLKHVQLGVTYHPYICIISIYRSLTGKFLHFLHTLDLILNFLHNNTIEIIIYGDSNINYLNDNDKKVN